MDFKLGRLNLNAVAQGVGGLVFGKDKSGSDDDDDDSNYVESLLGRIRNGVSAKDRREAIDELQSVMGESQSAQLAFGATGISVLMGILQEERNDKDMVQGALETLVSALTPINRAAGQKDEVRPAVMNSDLFSGEAGNISVLLSLLEDDEFNVQYYTLQLLTALLTVSLNRLQEAILTLPGGITRLMDMLMNREAIRNEALLVLTYLTREAEEIQKIVVFEGAFDKIFSIIQEEGGSEGGVVVQDCLELLNNLLSGASNQTLLRETTGFEPLISMLKHEGSNHKFKKQKTVNLLRTLEAIELLLVGGLKYEPGRDANRVSNQTVLLQKKVIEYLLMLGVENQRAPVDLRCSALRCIGGLLVGHPHNCDAFASKVLGEEPNVEPALNSILRILLRTSSPEEFVAADFVFKCFCEKNTDGQAMLASTMIPQPQSMAHAPIEEDINMSFGSMLLHSLTVIETDGDLETCSRAASVLSHILMDNTHCKERVLRVELEAPIPSLGVQEPLMHRIVKYLALSSMKNKESSHKNSFSSKDSYIQPVILKLLVTWLAEFPDAVHCFLNLRPHLTYLLELVSNISVSICTKGLAAVLLGECFLYNKSIDKSVNSSMVVDAICEKVGLTSYLLRLEDMQKSFIFVSAKPGLLYNVTEIGDVNDKDDTDWKHGESPLLMSLFDAKFVDFVKKLEESIRASIVDVYSHSKSEVVVLPVELEQRKGESDAEYIKRLKLFVESKCTEMQDLLGRNSTSAETLAKTSGSSRSGSDQDEDQKKIQTETLQRNLQQAIQQVEILKSEKEKVEAEASAYRNFANKMESDLKSLSEAYRSLEQANIQLESEAKLLRAGDGDTLPNLEAIKAEAKEEASKESEAELNDLLICLGQEQAKVEKLTSRLEELGEDVSSLLEGVADDIPVPEDSDGEEE